MAQHPLYLLDVFAETAYAGNQLAVISNAGDLSTAMMQSIAREMNYSETSFILSDKPCSIGYPVRIFTPEEELPFAGHPTLGTAYVILNEIMKTPASKVILNLKVGQIPVTAKQDDKCTILWMEQKPPSFGRTFAPADVAPVIGVRSTDIDDRFPVQEVSTGLPFVIVPLKSNGALNKARRNQEAFDAFVLKYGSTMIYLFSTEPEGPGNDISGRMFSVFQTIPEDPATGSATGCLGGYLVENDYFRKDRIDLRIEQGYEMGRPSLLYLKAERRQDSINIIVGGRVIMVAKGHLTEESLS